MCNHNFLETKKTNVECCSKCFCLSFKEIPLLSISSDLLKIFSMDPLSLKFNPNKYNINLSNIYTINYLNHRKYAIDFLKIQNDFFSFPNEIFHKALNYLDNIYLHNNISINIIEKICNVCLFFAIEFNECYSLNNSQIDFKSFEAYIKNKNLKDIKILCLKCLNYELRKYSIMDYINLFFSLGVILPDYRSKYLNVYKIYFKCIYFLNIIIKDNNSLKFSSYIMALTIIKKTLEVFKCFNEEIFHKIYGIKFYKEKFLICGQNLDFILSNYNIFNVKIINLTPKISNESTVENSICNESLNSINDKNM